MARTKGGLSEVPQGIDLKKEPGLDYIQNPQYKTYKDILVNRKSQDVQTFKSVFDHSNHKDVV